MKILSAMKMELAMKIGLAIILLVVCKGDPNKGEGEKDESMKTVLAEQKKYFEQQIADLRKELQEEKTNVREEFGKKLHEEKISTAKLRQADAQLLQAELNLRQTEAAERAENKALRGKIVVKRQDVKKQGDVISETKRLIREEIKSDETKNIMQAEIKSSETKNVIKAEIKSYLNTHSVCQMGNVRVDSRSGRFCCNKSIKVTFAPPFTKTPNAQAAISSFYWSKNSDISDAKVAPVYVTKTAMNIDLLSERGGMQYINAFWLACL